MKNAGLVLLVSSTLVLALAGAAGASAAKSPEFKPKVGEYLGTLSGPNAGITPISGPVGKEGKKYVVQVLASTVSVCSDGTRLQAGVGIPAAVKGKAFSATETGKDTFTGGTATFTVSTATFTVSGHFTADNAFTGTAKKESTAGPMRPEVGTCSTGNLKFTFHLKG